MAGAGATGTKGGGLVPQRIVEDVLKGDMTKIDEHAEALASRLVEDDLTPSQVRNFYGSLAKLRVERDPQKRLAQARMHRARLAYLTARAKDSRKDPARYLWEVFGPLLRQVDEKQLDFLCDFAEAVVAYHKYFEQAKKGKR